LELLTFISLEEEACRAETQPVGSEHSLAGTVDAELGGVAEQSQASEERPFLASALSLRGMR
jgi:hypothetical protein